ncbi:MAG: hypothetical protein ACFE9S_07665 [Candidatus Hermodarchaeota archaeon]
MGSYPILERYTKKQGVDKKTGKEKQIEIKPNYKPIPLSKLALVCDICGYELSITKIKKYSPIFCPRGCDFALQVRVVGNIAHTHWSDKEDNLKVAEKFIVKRIK